MIHFYVLLIASQQPNFFGWVVNTVSLLCSSDHPGTYQVGLELIENLLASASGNAGIKGFLHHSWPFSNVSL